MNQLKNLFIASALCVGVSSCSGPEKKVPAAIPSDPEIEANIKEWLGKMTLEEKIGQMCEITIDVVSDFEESKKHGFVLNPAMLDTVIGKYKVGSLLNVPLSIAQTKEKWAEAIKGEMGRGNKADSGHFHEGNRNPLYIWCRSDTWNDLYPWRYHVPTRYKHGFFF